jgi:hypothetical protein
VPHAEANRTGSPTRFRVGRLGACGKLLSNSSPAGLVGAFNRVREWQVRSAMGTGMNQRGRPGNSRLVSFKQHTYSIAFLEQTAQQRAATLQLLA